MPFPLSFPGNGQQKMLCILVLQELFEGVPKRLPVFVEIQFVLVGHFMSILGRGVSRLSLKPIGEVVYVAKIHLFRNFFDVLKGI